MPSPTMRRSPSCSSWSRPRKRSGAERRGSGERGVLILTGGAAVCAEAAVGVPRPREFRSLALGSEGLEMVVVAAVAVLRSARHGAVDDVPAVRGDDRVVREGVVRRVVLDQQFGRPVVE